MRSDDRDNEECPARAASEEIHDGPLKEDPAVRLIGIVLAGLGVEVDSIAIEKAIIADQKDFDRGIRQQRAVYIVSGNRSQTRIFRVQFRDSEGLR